MRLWPSSAWTARVGYAVVFSLGVGFSGVHVAHALEIDEDLQTFLVGIAIPMLFAAGLVAGSGWLARSDLDGSSVVRIAAWAVIGAVALGASNWLVILHDATEGITSHDALYLVTGQSSVGAVVGFVVGVYDVRQREARADAVGLSNRLTVVNRILRHDIRNLANVIQGRVDLLAEQTGDSDHVEPIRRNAARLVELGDQARAMEDVLRGESGQRTTIELVAVLEDRCDRLASTHESVTVTTDFPERAPVLAHPLLGSAVEHVLENAVEHNEREGPRVWVDCSSTDDEGSVEVRIADDGPGIPPAELAVLERGFETQLRHTSGLGLWLVNWVVHQSGGDVWFEANEPRGSVVCMRFDRVPDDRAHPVG